MDKQDTTLYERIAEFEAAIKKLAWDRSIRVDNVLVRDNRRDKLEIEVRFSATSGFIRQEDRT
jgi:hypothetical protein